MTVYDLHSHTTASDGVLTPEELIIRAKHRGVHVLAITDHDSISGLQAAQNCAFSQDISIINGIELSVTWKKNNIHVIGLNIDTTHQELSNKLVELQQIRQARAIEIGTRLQKAGIKNALTGAQQFSANNNITRTHFARFLVKSGKASSMSDVFKRYLTHGKPGYVSVEWVSLENAVELIKSAGGQAVIAHPARYKMTNAKMKKMLGDFTACGGSAIEVVNSGCTKQVIENNARLANQFGLSASIGSDFHSPDNQYIDLGRFSALPGNVTPIWHDWKMTERLSENRFS